MRVLKFNHRTFPLVPKLQFENPEGKYTRTLKSAAPSSLYFLAPVIFDAICSK